MDSHGLSNLCVTICEVGKVSKRDAKSGLSIFPFFQSVIHRVELFSVLDFAVVEEEISTVGSGTTTNSSEVAIDDSSFLSAW